MQRMKLEMNLRKIAPTLIDAFPDFLNNPGIFAKYTSMPWYNVADAQTLNIDFVSRFASLPLSPMMIRLSSALVVNDTDIDRIARVLIAHYGDNWIRQWELLGLDYDPISNYDMEETETSKTTHDDVRTEDRTDNLTNTNDLKDVSNLSGDVTTNESGNGSRDKYAFNSPAPSKYDATSETSKTDTTNTSNQTDTHTGTITSDRKENGTTQDTGTSDVNRTLTRKGNIGVTTTQQMIESERNLRMWNFFDSILFADMRKFMTLNIWQ